MPVIKSIRNFKLLSPELLLFAGFLALMIIQEIFILYFLTGSQGYFILLNLLMLLIVLFVIYYALFLVPFPWILIAAYLFHKAYLFAHMAYYSYYKVVMDLLVIWGIAGAGIKVFFEGGVLPFLSEMLILLLDLPLFIILVIKYKKIHNLLCAQKKRLLFIPLSFFLVYQALFTAAEILHPDFLNTSRKIAVHGTLGFSIVNRILAKEDAAPGSSGESLPADRQADPARSLQAALNNKPGFNERRWPGTAGTGYCNFVCLQVESLQCGLENVKHNGQYVMPYLHSLTATALYYPYCFTYHTVGGTSDCEFSVLNNVEPKSNERMVARQYQHTNSVIKVLKQHHYQPVAFHNYHKQFYDRVSAFARIGFDAYYDFYDMKLTKPIWGNEDREMFEFIINNRSEWKPPFILYVLTLSSHPGFDHINRYFKAPFLADIKKKRDRDALTCFNYVDIQLEKFITGFRQLYPDTWIFIYGDHSLASVDFAGHLVRSGVTAGDEYLEFVTLFILAPDSRQGDFSGTLASTHDIGPTILSLLPAPADGAGCIAYTAFGGSLLLDDVRLLQIPFKNTMHDRGQLLQQIRAKMEPYRNQ